MPTLHDLFERYDSLTTKQRGVLDYLRKHPETICFITLRGLSEAANVSEVSILRLCRTLGFSGFSDLKEQFRLELSEDHRSTARYELIGPEAFPTLSKKRAAILSEILTDEMRSMSALLTGLDGEKLFRCANAMLAANKVYVFGHDGGKLIGDYLSHRLGYFRINALSIQMANMDSVRAQLSKLTKGDFVVVLSFPDYYLPSRSISRFAEHNGIPIMTITDSMDSPAIVPSSYTFLCDTRTISFINSYTAPVSLITALMLCIASELGEDRLRELQEAERRVNRFINWDSPDAQENFLWPTIDTLRRN